MSRVVPIISIAHLAGTVGLHTSAPISQVSLSLTAEVSQEPRNVTTAVKLKPTVLIIREEGNDLFQLCITIIS